MAIGLMARAALGLCGTTLLAVTWAVACMEVTDAKSRPGADPETGTTASAVTWSDAKPAFSIDCELPGDCRNRAFALCRGNGYSVLKTDTTTSGDARAVTYRTTTVVRCS